MPVYADYLSRFDVSKIFRANDIEGAGLAADDISAGKSGDGQWSEAVFVPTGIDAVFGQS